MRTTLRVPAALARALLAPLVALGVGMGVGLAPATWAGDPPPPPPPPTPAPPTPAPQPGPAPSPASGIEDSLTLGARYFDESIAYVAKGGALGQAVDVFARLDAKWDLEDNHGEGPYSLWFLAPDKMRTEMTVAAKTTTKILNGERAWAILPNGTLVRKHATPGAEAELKQMKEDMIRIQDMTAFVTLQGLKGPGIVFEYQGQTKGSGLYDGSWVRVARRSPDGRKITFYLGYEKAADGTPHATFPGVVRIDGDPSQGLWSEDWILSDWDSGRVAPRPYRYPARIHALRKDASPAKAAEPYRTFLLAAVEDLDINSGIDPARFEPPAPR